MPRLNVNGKAVEVDVDPSTPLLWVLRERFGDCPGLRLSEMPEISVSIILSTADPSGVGDPPPIAPAVANPVAALTGKRLRALPYDLSKV